MKSPGEYISGTNFGYKMAIELRQQLKLTQQLIMTPQLQMAIKLLQLSRLELLDMISQEMEENPALEEVVDVAAEDQLKEEPETSSDNIDAEKEVTIEEKINEDIDWENYIDEYNSPGRLNFENEQKDTPRYETFIAHKKSLSDHLLWQLMMSSPTDSEQKIG